MPGPYDTSPLGTGKNWVTKAGGLPPFVRAVAHALIRQGKTESEAIQIALGVMKRAIASGKWASLKGHATAGTVAKSGASVARWEQMKLDHTAEVTMSIDLTVTDAMCPYQPTGDEKASVQAHLKGIDTLKRKGNTRQAKAAEEALIRSKTNRARKMPNGAVRAHTRPEVEAGLAHLRTTNLSGGSMPTVDLAGGSTIDKMLPDMASVQKAASKLSKLPPGLRKSMAARLVARAKQLGGTLNLAVDQADRDAAQKAGLTLPGTDSYPLAGPDGKFSRALAQKAVRMVGLGGANKAKIQAWLCKELKANGAADLIPSSWQQGGSK